MDYLFPGMDPYLEHPALWEGIQARLIIAIANHLQPKLDPRDIASIEERVFIAGPRRRVPDVWIQKVRDAAGTVQLSESDCDTAQRVHRRISSSSAGSPRTLTRWGAIHFAMTSLAASMSRCH